MTLDLPRRGFVTAVCAVEAQMALTPTGAIAGGDVASTHRSASD